MSFVVKKSKFMNAIQKAYPFISGKTSMQSLVNFKITFNPEIFEIYATDLDHSIKVFDVVESGEGSYEITVNAKKIFEIIKELNEEDIDINFDENVLIISSGENFLCKISGSDTQDFPDFPEIDEYEEIVFDNELYKNIVSKTCFAVAEDKTRAALCGVYWEITDGYVSMVSTDGHRLGYSRIDGEFSSNNISAIVSPKTLLNVLKMFSDKDNGITVRFSMKYVVFVGENLILYSKKIEGEYPDYEKVIPKENPKKAVVNRLDILSAVKRVSVLSNIKTHLVKFIFRNESLEIVVQNREIGGEAKQIIPIEYTGDEHSIGFNGSYLSEILNIIKSENVRFEMNTQISAVLIYPTDENKDLFLIMPLRVLDEA